MTPEERLDLRRLILKVIAKRAYNAERLAEEILDEIEAVDLTISNNKVTPFRRAGRSD
jgi:hypothetical protein